MSVPVFVFQTSTFPGHHWCKRLSIQLPIAVSTDPYQHNDLSDLLHFFVLLIVSITINNIMIIIILTINIFVIITVITLQNNGVKLLHGNKMIMGYLR